MKRLALAIGAMIAVAGPLVATHADAQGRSNNGRDGYDNRGRNNRNDNRQWDNNRRDNDRWDNNSGRNDNRNWNNNGRRDNDRWDDRRYNGYYLGDRWYYGPPQVSYYDRYDYRPAYRSWQRGGYLPPYYNSYVVYDYSRYRLRPPPRGYHWVQSNNDYVLAAIATGLILEVISGGY